MSEEKRVEGDEGSRPEGDREAEHAGSREVEYAESREVEHAESREAEDAGSRESAETLKQEFHVVGIGASAGGLEALEEFFEAQPHDLGVAYVVIQHLSPDFKSHMEELLGRKTAMRIRRVENGMQVERDTVYLIPPNMEMVMSGGKLLLTEMGPKRQLSHPIDQFFRSLAADVGRYSVGIVLSGTGSDGSRGVRDIEEAGGLLLTQDEQSAQFDGMPLNAVATGLVHVVSNPTGLSDALVRYVRDGISSTALADHAQGIDSTEGASRVFQLLREDHGIDFSLYKSSTVGRRIDRRIQLGGFESLEAYAAHLECHREELNDLYKDLLIGVTRFFRDEEAFAALESDVVPAIVDNCSDGATIRIWVAGCASGEEAYSLAMIFLEYIEKNSAQVGLKIFATDVHHVSLSSASKGVYAAPALEHVSPERRERFFIERRDGFHVTREVRQSVLFAPHNVISDAPFTQLDLVVCRNLLIYLQTQPQKKALAMFHFALKTGGVLWLGPSESPGDIADEFQVVNSRWRIYRKRRDVRLPLDTRLTQMAVPKTVPRGPQIPQIPVASMAAPKIDRGLLGSYDRLLDRYMPASLLVGENMDLIHAFGGGEEYLKLRAGRATTNVLEIVAEELKTSLAGALQHSIRVNDVVRYSGVKFEGGPEPLLDLVVEPIHDSSTKVTNYLISFLRREVDSEEQQAAPEKVGTQVTSSQVTGERIRSLESELRFTRENLQATIEELETSNEELQATNEEMVASNEELQSTNEELHSVNEELYTVNAQYQRRVRELGEANDDMDNLLAVTRVGVIFLDAELHIRRFTPEVARIFGLSPNDVGRSFREFSRNLESPTLIEDLENVAFTKEELEYETQDKQGRRYLARMSAYRTGTELRGVVLTIIDIDDVTQLKVQATLQASIIDSTPDFVGTLNGKREITYLNTAAKRMYGAEDDAALADLDLSSFHTPEALEKLENVILPTAEKEGRWQGESELQLPDGRILPTSQVVLAHKNPRGQVVQFSTIIRDVTDLRASQRRVEESESQLRRIIDNMLSFVGLLQVDGTLIEANLAATQAAGVDRESVVGKKFWDVIWWNHSPKEQEKLKAAVAKAAQGQVVRYDATICLSEGRMMEIDFMLVPAYDSAGNVTHLVPSGVDITARKQAESELRLRQVAIDSATVGIVIADPRQEDCPIIYANRGFTGLTGFQTEESVGRNCRFLQGADTDADDVLLIREAIENGEDCRVTLLNYKKDGTPFWNDLQVTAVRDEHDEIVSFVGVQHDITSQIAAEEMANEAAERVIALLDSTAEGIYGLDREGRCTFCNRACVELLGYSSADELVGKNMHAVIHHTRVDGSPYPQEECPSSLAFASGERVHVDTEYFWKADGSRFPVEYWSHPIRKKGEVVGAVVTFLDTSARMEEQLELLRAKKSADAANHAKSQFLANMSHELRTPLAVIMGFADIILDISDDGQVREHIAVIRRNGHYLLRLLNDILDLSRVEAGAVRLESRVCNLHLFLSDLYEMMSVRAAEASRPLEFIVAPELPQTITTDEARLRQILVNLIGNAIKFSPDGRVTVTMEMTELRGQPAIEFSVTDTGIGMSEEQQGKLFQPFTQASDEVGQQFGGSGLGLSICKRLIDYLEGHITVKSQLNEGSTFTVKLPVAPVGEYAAFTLESRQDSNAKAAAANSRARSIEKIEAKVLIADDMRDVRYIAQRLLEKRGCKVTAVENGALAVDAIRAALEAGEPFDLAVIDVQMPVMGGIETIAKLKEEGMSLPVIALTADAMKGARERLLEAGFNAYHTKPIQAKRFAQTVRDLILESNQK